MKFALPFFFLFMIIDTSLAKKNVDVGVDVAKNNFLGLHGEESNSQHHRRDQFEYLESYQVRTVVGRGGVALFLLPREKFTS